LAQWLIGKSISLFLAVLIDSSRMINAIIASCVIYSLFMISFLWPKTWLLYTVSAFLGVGAAIIWTAQGAFLSRCSDETTISRNSGIFWAMLQMR
jgi:MFS family permease